MYIISIVFIFVASFGMFGGTLADELNLGGNVLHELTVIVLGIITIFFTLWKLANDKNGMKSPLSFPFSWNEQRFFIYANTSFSKSIGAMYVPSL